MIQKDWVQILIFLQQQYAMILLSPLIVSIFRWVVVATLGVTDEAPNSTNLTDIWLERGCWNLSLIFWVFFLENNIPDHRPILLLEHRVDYGSTHFHIFHSFFDMDGFDNVVRESCSNALLGTYLSNP